MHYYIGCSGFYNKDWKELFYPQGLAQSKWFEHYCTRFNTLELNTTFYRFPRVTSLQNWYNKSPADFKFSVKAPRLISHYKQFNACESLLNDFYSSIREGLKEKLGAVLFQLPARVAYSDSFLQLLIQNFDNSFNNVIEFRNASWWKKKVIKQLSNHNISFCGVSIKDLPGEITANTPVLYYRFHGIKRLYFSEYPKKDIQNFAEQLKQTKKVETVFVYFNNTATIAAINNAFQLMEFLKPKG